MVQHFLSCNLCLELLPVELASALLKYKVLPCHAAIACVTAVTLSDPHPGNLLATRDGTLVYLDFGMMSEAPEYARFAIMAHVVHLVNR